MELVAIASLEPSKPAAEAEPTINEPPWILPNLSKGADCRSKEHTKQALGQHSADLGKEGRREP